MPLGADALTPEGRGAARRTEKKGWRRAAAAASIDGGMGQGDEIPLLSTRAGPRPLGRRSVAEYRALIAYTSVNKSKDNDWFRIPAANPEGTRWEGTCWYVHNFRRYEFPLQFDVPVAYHQVAPEIELPTLDGKIHKTYRGGKICLMGHFKPLWAKNCPRFGLAHAPWLAAEVPILVDSGMVKHNDDEAPQQTPWLRLALLLLLSCLCYHVQMNHVGFRVVQLQQLYIHCNGNGKPLFVQMKFGEVYTYYSSRRLHTPCKPYFSMTYGLKNSNLATCGLGAVQCGEANKDDVLSPKATSSYASMAITVFVKINCENRRQI